MNASTYFSRVSSDIKDIVSKSLPDPESLGIAPQYLDAQIFEVSQFVSEDLEALATNDAAAYGLQDYVYESYLSFRAVMFYRVAHQILQLAAANEPTDDTPHSIDNDDLSEDRLEGKESAQNPSNYILRIARSISERAKVETAIDIHPSAKIGRKFVIDHGANTVIGAQTEIGDNCYILQNVTLGARAMKTGLHNKKRRHPRIGNNVQIAGGVVVFGNVMIGDNCFIEAGSRVTDDVPAGHRVSVISTLQMTRHEKIIDSIEVYGVIPVPDGFVISGRGLSHLKPIALNHKFERIKDGIKEVELKVVQSQPTQIRFITNGARLTEPAFLALIDDNDTIVCVITNAKAFHYRIA